MTDRAIRGMLALCPGRGRLATLEQVLVQPDLANDLIVIVGDSSRRRDKRATYRRSSAHSVVSGVPCSGFPKTPNPPSKARCAERTSRRSHHPPPAPRGACW